MERRGEERSKSRGGKVEGFIQTGPTTVYQQWAVPTRPGLAAQRPQGGAQRTAFPSGCLQHTVGLNIRPVFMITGLGKTNPRSPAGRHSARAVGQCSCLCTRTCVCICLCFCLCLESTTIYVICKVITAQD